VPDKVVGVMQCKECDGVGLIRQCQPGERVMSDHGAVSEDS